VRVRSTGRGLIGTTPIDKRLMKISTTHILRRLGNSNHPAGDNGLQGLTGPQLLHSHRDVRDPCPLTQPHDFDDPAVGEPFIGLNHHRPLAFGRPRRL
jgi:hypothetical protein